MQESGDVCRESEAVEGLADSEEMVHVAFMNDLRNH